MELQNGEVILEDFERQALDLDQTVVEAAVIGGLWRVAMDRVQQNLDVSESVLPEATDPWSALASWHRDPNRRLHRQLRKQWSQLKAMRHAALAISWETLSDNGDSLL
jgi:hypothetical protein